MSNYNVVWDNWENGTQNYQFYSTALCRCAHAESRVAPKWTRAELELISAATQGGCYCLSARANVSKLIRFLVVIGLVTESKFNIRMAACVCVCVALFIAKLSNQRISLCITEKYAHKCPHLCCIFSRVGGVTFTLACVVFDGFCRTARYLTFPCPVTLLKTYFRIEVIYYASFAPTLLLKSSDTLHESLNY